MLRRLLIPAGCVLALAMPGAADDSGRIYGRIETAEGDALEGFIRWDKNEADWVDILDATKEMKHLDDVKGRRKYRDRETSIEIFGIRIGNERSSDYEWSSTAQAGIRFGHLKSMEILDDETARLTLKSGQEIELTQMSTDIGSSIREIIIEDEREGEMELVWDDLETIEFMSAPSQTRSNFGPRLYGTLVTQDGEKYTGFVCWDVDEVFANDVLDGDEDHRSRKVKFGRIASAERYSAGATRITLRDGQEMILRGSNDVDDDNRGILILDPALGQVTVHWDEFDRLDFTDPPAQVGYDDFDGGGPLKGTVFTEDGESHTGTIRWDNDEEYSWEILNGSYHDADFDIELGLVKSIEKRSARSAIVTLLDGRSFRLSGSNDVDDDNKGIFIKLTDGEEVEVAWDEFDHVEFAK
ncbi:MAG TPA: hypothetical protein VN285_07565 [Candidatus Deferrimicrobium sp.]|nr:hypothetical protein [Candidatus Deferrimicrobium sp.]